MTRKWFLLLIIFCNLSNGSPQVEYVGMTKQFFSWLRKRFFITRYAFIKMRTSRHVFSGEYATRKRFRSSLNVSNWFFDYREAKFWQQQTLKMKNKMNYYFSIFQYFIKIEGHNIGYHFHSSNLNSWIIAGRLSEVFSGSLFCWRFLSRGKSVVLQNWNICAKNNWI